MRPSMSRQAVTEVALSPASSSPAIERVLSTFVEERSRVFFPRALVPKLSALKRCLDAYPRWYSHNRVNTGCFANCRGPGGDEPRTVARLDEGRIWVASG